MWNIAIRHLGPEDITFAGQLDSLQPSPSLLYCAGTMPPLDRAVAIVGTRHADPETVDFAAELAEALVGEGCVIVSGGARGVDRAAHEGALDAGGSTVAVLPLALSSPYPEDHVPLFRRIVFQGALLSEVAQDDGIGRYRFLARNRLVAALAQVTVVVQAPSRSGALSTARYARKLGRHLLVVPSGPWNRRSAGGLEFLRRGWARLCCGAHEVIAALEEPPPFPVRTQVTSRVQPPARSPLSLPGLSVDDPTEGLDPQALRVYSALGTTPSHLDVLVARTGLPVFQIQQILLMLSLKGIVQPQGVGQYRRVR